MNITPITIPNSNAQPGGRIPSLDGLRAVSLGLVLLGHMCGTRNFWDGKQIAIFGIGEFGVRVFFIISGLLITQLLLTEIDKTNGINLLKFYFRRTFRIFPAYYAFLLFVILVQPLGWFLLNSGDALAALTYTSNYHLDRSWNIGHTWSLAVEEQFYLLWPAALLLLGVRRGLLAAASLVFLCPLIRLGIHEFWPSREHGIGHQFETVADALALGCVLALKREWPAELRAAFDWLLRSPLMWLMPFIAIAGNSLSDHPRPSYLFGYSIANFGIACCIVWTVENHETGLGRLLNSRPLVYVGMLSYSIYLWQQLFLNRHSTLAINSFPLNLALAIGTALLSYYLIERPSLNYRQTLEARLFPKPHSVVVNSLETRDKVLPFVGGSPSVQAQRALRLDALQNLEARDESPTPSFLPALELLETRKDHGTLDAALQRVNLSMNAEK